MAIFVAATGCGVPLRSVLWRAVCDHGVTMGVVFDAWRWSEGPCDSDRGSGLQRRGRARAVCAGQRLCDRREASGSPQAANVVGDLQHPDVSFDHGSSSVVRLLRVVDEHEQVVRRARMCEDADRQ